jgi:hypothetical protein
LKPFFFINKIKNQHGSLKETGLELLWMHPQLVKRNHGILGGDKWYIYQASQHYEDNLENITIGDSLFSFSILQG